jgi:hypothetical protein
MASTNRKRPAVLHDNELGECLIGSKIWRKLIKFKCDSDNELDNCAILDVVVDGDSDQYIILDFVWEDTNNYKGLTGIVLELKVTLLWTTLFHLFGNFYNNWNSLLTLWYSHFVFHFVYIIS